MGGSSDNHLEFAITYMRRRDDAIAEQSVVRRSMADLKWLDDTFLSHKVLGGTLCGRILPPFPGSGSWILSSHFQKDTESLVQNSITSTGGAIAAAATASVGRIADVAKSLFGTYLSSAVAGTGLHVATSEDHSTGHEPPSSSSSCSRKLTSSGGRRASVSLPESYYNPNSPAGKAQQLERYLNYLLEHPALSTSFPLNTILKVSFVCYGTLQSTRFLVVITDSSPFVFCCTGKSVWCGCGKAMLGRVLTSYQRAKSANPTTR